MPKPDIFDITGLAGAGLLIYGIARIDVTLAIITAGVMLLIFGLMGARSRSKLEG